MRLRGLSASCGAGGGGVSPGLRGAHRRAVTGAGKRALIIRVRPVRQPHGVDDAEQMHLVPVAVCSAPLEIQKMFVVKGVLAITLIFRRNKSYKSWFIFGKYH